VSPYLAFPAGEDVLSPLKNVFLHGEKSFPVGMRILMRIFAKKPVLGTSFSVDPFCFSGSLLNSFRN